MYLLLGSARAEDLRLAVSTSPLSAPILIALERHFFQQQGLNVIPTMTQGGHRAMAALLSGEADIATSSEAVVMFNAAKRADIQIFSTFVTSDNDVKILVRSDSRIGAVTDLRGRRVGTIRNTAAHYFLSQTLQLNGLSTRDVTVVNITPEQAAQDLEHGDVDAVAIWEPHGYQILSQLGDRVRALPHDRAYLETFNMVARRGLIVQKAAAVDKFLRALGQAVEFIEANPQASQGIVAAALHQDPAQIRSVWQDFHFKVGLDQWLLTTLESQLAWAKSETLVPPGQEVNFLNHVALSPLDRVNRRAITIYR